MKEYKHDKHIGIGGLHCSCCNPYKKKGKHGLKAAKKIINRKFRRNNKVDISENS